MRIGPRHTIGRVNWVRPLARRALNEPHPARLPLDHSERSVILAAHDQALSAGEAGYADPTTGLFVLTARFLADRGICCGRGCRHCPYTDGPESDPWMAPSNQ
jgi:hypothetical protein